MRDSKIVELSKAWPREVPIRGFNLVKGEVWYSGIKMPGVFLVALEGGRQRSVVPRDLYVKFSQVSDADSAVAFANGFGNLTSSAKHFHRDDGAPETGEPLDDWLLWSATVREVIDLWYESMGDRRKASRRIQSLLKREKMGAFLQFPPPIDDPIEYARTIALLTINYGLAPVEYHPQPPCGFPKCSSALGVDGADDTRAELQWRPGRTSAPQLAIVSTNLLKNLFVQLASFIEGERKLIRCEAPDCGQYVDVTDSAHPNARRMHDRCEERLRKRRSRERQRASRQRRRTKR
jgi:hypothetical protein